MALGEPYWYSVDALYAQLLESFEKIESDCNLRHSGDGVDCLNVDGLVEVRACRKTFILEIHGTVKKESCHQDSTEAGSCYCDQNDGWHDIHLVVG